MKYFLVLTLTGLLTLTFSCKKKKQDDSTPFDKGTMLASLADQHILPLMSQFSNDLQDLETKFITFSSDKSSANLNEVISSWKNAYVTWQNVKIFDFGPIRDIGFKGATGTFPTDTTKINDNITNGGYSLASASNVDAVGLHALDFLLSHPDALNRFVLSPERTNYALEVIQKMVSEMNAVENAWVSYRSNFVSSTGTEATSSFSQLVNEFTRDYELCKNAKVGIPIGKQSLGVQMPEYLETPLSGYSFELIIANISSIQKVFNGEGLYGENGTGFYDYLVHEERSSLANSINSNFSDIIAQCNSFAGNMETEMTNNPSELDNLYNLMQSQVVLIKTDMTSVFGVLITYQDNDGD